MATVMAHPPGLADGSRTNDESSQERSTSARPKLLRLERQSTPAGCPESCEPPLLEICPFPLLCFQGRFFLRPYPRFDTLQLVEQPDSTGTTAETPFG